jgi:hypothetical protein
VVLETKTFQWPNPYLHFCDNLPFEEDLDVHVVNVFIIFTEELFVPSLIEIGQLVLEKIF